MVQVDYRIEYGEIKSRQDNKSVTLKIHWANALCAFIYHYKENGKKWARLVDYFADEEHLAKSAKNWNGDPLLFVSELGKIESIKLNLYYKEGEVLLKHFVKGGYKVTCYYKEPKKK